MLPEIFIKYCDIFANEGFNLYMVGGTSRDYLLGRDFSDFDFATDATPDEMEKFLSNIDLTFAKYGSIRIKDGDIEIDVTSFRKEGEYIDSRHPSSITFIRDMKEDSIRRDFTINALYINKEGKVFDFYNGLDDLKNKIIRFIGEPSKRIEEDPLRILRAERFASLLGFSFEDKTFKALQNGKPLLNKINKEKVKLELYKLTKNK